MLRGKNCTYDHPAACKKLLKHGNRGPNGCTLGPKCDKFHPKMCVTSLKKKECFRNSCKLVHVVGTKRKKSKTESNAESSIDTPINQDLKPAPDTSNENPFLEALQAMRRDIMKELDQRLALHVQHPMSLNQGAVVNTQTLQQPQTQTWQTVLQAQPGGQMQGSRVPTQGAHAGQQVLLFPMQAPH